MVGDGEVVLRRTWPQRFVLLACVGVVGGALVAAWFVQTLYDGLTEVGRIEIARDVLITDTAPGEPVNFLLVGTDSAEGINPDDPIHIGREIDPRGRHNADSISLVRLDPRSGQAWVMSIPRDLYVDVPDGPPSRINQTLLVGGPDLLVRTVSETFGVEVNHYIVLDFLAFREVVDKLGGVPVWFDHQTRSLATGLSILEPGCHVLGGVDALRYVRARKDYQEFIDGDWITTQSRDFERIARQQDFLVLTIDRAIQRGARNPRTLASLVEAGALSVELDQALTVAEIADLGRSFASFEAETLARFTPEVTTEFTDDGSTYIGEVLKPDVNDDLYAIFRGEADGLSTADVKFDILASSATNLEADADLLAGAGFEVDRVAILADPVEESVVVHAPGDRAAAILVARRLIPIPAVAEDPSAIEMTLVLGDEHEQVTFLAAHAFQKTLDAVADRGNVEVPDLGGSTDLETMDPEATGSAASAPSTTTIVEPSTTVSPTTTTTTGIVGRAPEGESCS